MNPYKMAFFAVLIPLAYVLVLFGWSFVAGLASAKSDMAVAVAVLLVALFIGVLAFVATHFYNKLFNNTNRKDSQ